MEWIFVLALIAVFGLLVLLDMERSKRREFETVVAMLRDRESLNERGCDLLMTAKKFDWNGNELPD